MSLTPTMSRDGKRRATVRIEFRVGRWELACAAAGAILDRDGVHAHGARGDDLERIREAGADLTKGGVEAAARELLEAHGHDLYYAVESAMDSDAIREAAEAAVDRLFPEFGRAEKEAVR